MGFSIFTRRTRSPSTRLRLIARYLQFSGILTGTALLGFLLARLFVKDLNFNLPLPLPVMLVYIVLSATSFYQIGRGLLLRQRWAGYLAAFTFRAPLVKKFIISGADLSIAVAIYPLLALLTIASVWPELGTVRDSEFAENDEGDEFPKRNRGFGEKRTLPSASMPELSPQTSIHISDPKVIRESEKIISRNTRS